MGSLADAMANVVQHIQTAAESRRTHLGQLQQETTRFLGQCRAAGRERAAELRERASELRRQLDGAGSARLAAEKARQAEAQQFIGSTRDAVRRIGVSVSELRSDAHNLVQRFTLEHRDMARTLSSTLAAETSARLGASRQGIRERRGRMNALRAQLRADARTLHASLRQVNTARRQAARQMLDELAADIRQASRTWRGELKKKEPPSLGEVTTGATEAIAEVAAATVPVQEPPGEVTVEEPRSEGAVEEEPGEVTAQEPRGEGAVEEEQALRVAARAERVLAVIQAHPDGIRLVEIGNEMGVDWRGLIAVVRVLMDEGKVEKIDNTYYPAQR